MGHMLLCACCRCTARTASCWRWKQVTPNHAHTLAAATVDANTATGCCYALQLLLVLHMQCLTAVPKQLLEQLPCIATTAANQPKAADTAAQLGDGCNQCSRPCSKPACAAVHYAGAHLVIAECSAHLLAAHTLVQRDLTQRIIASNDLRCPLCNLLCIWGPACMSSSSSQLAGARLMMHGPPTCSCTCSIP